MRLFCELSCRDARSFCVCPFGSCRSGAEYQRVPRRPQQLGMVRLRSCKQRHCDPAVLLLAQPARARKEHHRLHYGQGEPFGVRFACSKLRETRRKFPFASWLTSRRRTHTVSKFAGGWCQLCFVTCPFSATPVTGGSLSIAIQYMGIPLVSQTLDLCGVLAQVRRADGLCFSLLMTTIVTAGSPGDSVHPGVPRSSHQFEAAAVQPVYSQLFPRRPIHGDRE